MTNRQKQAIATKQKILDVAERLIMEKDFEDVSVDDIVSECGVAKGTFYHYFKSKDDILVYIIRSPYEHLRREHKASEGQPYLQRLRLFLENWFKLVDQFNLHFSRQTHKIYTSPEMMGSYGGNLTHMDLGMELVRECIAGAIESGELRADTPLEILSREMMFSMQGCTLYQCKYAEEFDVMEWSRDFIALVFDSLLRPYIIQH